MSVAFMPNKMLAITSNSSCPYASTSTGVKSFERTGYRARRASFLRARPYTR